MLRNRQKGVANVATIEAQAQYAKQETSTCLLAINNLTLEHQAISAVLTAVKAKTSAPAVDPNLLVYVNRKQGMLTSSEA